MWCRNFTKNSPEQKKERLKKAYAEAEKDDDRPDPLTRVHPEFYRRLGTKSLKKNNPIFVCFLRSYYF